jgi:hypothetical protein
VGVAWTPGIAFGGSSTGITYSGGGPFGVYCLKGRMVYANFKITLTSKGAQVGAATVTGLPWSISNPIPGRHGSGQVTTASNFSGLTGAVQIDAVEASTTFAFNQWGAAGAANLTDANFTNTTGCNGALAYFM